MTWKMILQNWVPLLVLYPLLRSLFVLNTVRFRQHKCYCSHPKIVKWLGKNRCSQSFSIRQAKTHKYILCIWIIGLHQLHYYDGRESIMPHNVEDWLQFFSTNNSFSSKIFYFSSRYDAQSDEFIAFFHFFCFFGEMFRVRECVCKRVLYLFWPPATPTQPSFLNLDLNLDHTLNILKKVAHTSLRLCDWVLSLTHLFFAALPHSFPIQMARYK